MLRILAQIEEDGDSEFVDNATMDGGDATSAQKPRRL